MCRAGGPGGSAPGIRTASTWRPAGEPQAAGCSGCQRKCWLRRSAPGSRSAGISSTGPTPPRAAGGVVLAWYEQPATALDGSALEPGLDWVASTCSIAALLSEMKDSTQRISELVASIKSYSQMDRAAMQQIDVTDGIDSALVLLGHKRRPGIAVVRDYSASLPRIQAYPGELNQVWTNLIDNALDAMTGAGTLTLAARVEEEDIVVEVGDTGPGMPPQVASRAFDAFYTTKDAGKGTGLGLDIARRTVVERHGGLITIDSQPGNTVLRVRLPIRPPMRTAQRSADPFPT